METNLLDRMLSTYQSEQTPVIVTLQNKVHVSGKIRAFDSYVIVMEGQKREILYRHAVSCISSQAPYEQKRSAPASKPEQVRTVRKPTKSSTQRPRQHQPQAPQAMLSASTGDSGINNSMKDGLLRWMQEQKAAK